MYYKTHKFLDDLTFYKAHPNTCPYLDQQEETKILTYLPDHNSEYIYSELISSGFRRSQTIAYKPLCKNCQACQSIRVIVDDFKPSRSQRRVLKKNIDIERKIKPPYLTDMHFQLYQKYIHTRHSGEEMANMSFDDIKNMVETTHIDTIIVEYYIKNTQRLCGWVLTDLTAYGPSMVYSVFDPELYHQSLGVYAILNHIDFSIKLGVPYLFLGYWIKNCQKMDYKINFKPYQLYIGNKWIDFFD